MDTTRRTNLAVGLFLAAALAVIAYVSVTLGRFTLLPQAGYLVTAHFASAAGLKPGSNVEIAGVEVGRVERIELADYQARVVLWLKASTRVQEDAIASIKTRGLIGEKFVRIAPGGSDRLLPPHGRIREVETPVDFEELLARYIFGKV